MATAAGRPAARRDQALAALIYRTGWTQDELAKKEGKTHQWIAHRTRFGRFLDFATAVAKMKSLPNNLTRPESTGDGLRSLEIS